MKSGLALCASLLLLSVFLAPEIQAQDYYVVTKSKSNVRVNPPKNGKVQPVLTKVESKTRMRVLARNATTSLKKSWLKVELPDGKVGWIATRIVKLLKNAPAGGGLEPALQEPMLGSDTGGMMGAEPSAGMEEMPMGESPAAAAAPAEPSTEELGSDVLDDSAIPEIEILDEIDESQLENIE